jgi:hypothetical protein
MKRHPPHSRKPESHEPFIFFVETEDETVVIHKMYVLYIITTFPLIIGKKYKMVQSYIMIEVVIQKDSQSPLSFVFAAIFDGKIVLRKHSFMPELDTGKKI